MGSYGKSRPDRHRRSDLDHKVLRFETQTPDRYEMVHASIGMLAWEHNTPDEWMMTGMGSSKSSQHVYE